MFVKTYEEEYKDCQEAFLKLAGENAKLKAEIERRDLEIDMAYLNGVKAGWNYGMKDDPYGKNHLIRQILERVREARQALQNNEAEDE